jgi:hypothetical protein
MITAFKHDNSTIIGIYENLLDFAYSNFTFEILETKQIKITSKHFNNYEETEIISKVSYSKEYSNQEAIKDYIINFLKKDIKRYDIRIFKIEEI